MYETIQQIHSFLENVFVKMKISEISSLFRFYFEFLIFFFIALKSSMTLYRFCKGLEDFNVLNSLKCNFFNKATWLL